MHYLRHQLDAWPLFPVPERDHAYPNWHSGLVCMKTSQEHVPELASHERYQHLRSQHEPLNFLGIQRLTRWLKSARTTVTKRSSLCACSRAKLPTRRRETSTKHKDPTTGMPAASLLGQTDNVLELHASGSTQSLFNLLSSCVTLPMNAKGSKKARTISPLFECRYQRLEVTHVDWRRVNVRHHMSLQRGLPAVPGLAACAPDSTRGKWNAVGMSFPTQP